MGITKIGIFKIEISIWEVLFTGLKYRISEME